MIEQSDSPEIDEGPRAGETAPAGGGAPSLNVADL